MAVADRIADLPTACAVGTKKKSKGYKTSWTGYPLPLDVADGGIPISGLLTTASTHASQVAIPLAQISHQRVVNLYDRMDNAYDAPQLHEVSCHLMFGILALTANQLMTFVMEGIVSKI